VGYAGGEGFGERGAGRGGGDPALFGATSYQLTLPGKRGTKLSATKGCVLTVCLKSDEKRIGRQI